MAGGIARNAVISRAVGLACRLDHGPGVLSWLLVPDLAAEPAGEDLPALVAALRAANARLREIIEAKDAQLTVAEAGLRGAEARLAALSERVAELERRLGQDSSETCAPSTPTGNPVSPLAWAVSR